MLSARKANDFIRGAIKGQLVDDARNIRTVTSNIEVVWEEASLSLNGTTCGYAR